MATQETKTSGDSAIRILLTLAMDIQKIRDINKEAFKLNDSESNTLSSEDTFKAARAGLHLGGVDLDTIMEGLPKEQMKEDLHDALIVSMAYKDPCVSWAWQCSSSRAWLFLSQTNSKMQSRQFRP